MTTSFDLDYPALQDRIAPLSLSPAELHGSLCGFLCAGGEPVPGQWLEQLKIDPDGLQPQARTDLEHLRRNTVQQLDDPELGFMLMLPDDDSEVAQRVVALSEWCASFLGGYGLVVTAQHDALSEDARDALRDLGRIAAFGYEAGESEEDESAFTEILEYVRVAVILLRQEGQPAAQPDSGTRH